MPVKFHTENISFNLRGKLVHRQWIQKWIGSNNAACGELNIIFISNKRIKRINQKYLNHDYYTDVITFDYSDGTRISGDIFISVDQVKINARRYQTEVEDELRRVMIHGVNHLLGYADGKEEEKEIMRRMENEALHLWLKMV